MRGEIHTPSLDSRQIDIHGMDRVPVSKGYTRVIPVYL